ncbi:PAP1-domain-containing protein [Rhypophila decipiens]|uniref:PAP1-domain-containing protein n=1 Tax=Rhypophila decipiens TaxID=261697 RepID=A0AAN6YJN5_9PEZI|nr:PAP1-domain-containing protein [Rhypophila decipiens]
MTSTQNPLTSFVLTPQQQNLLFAALNSNKSPAAAASNNALTFPTSTIDGSPELGLEGSYQNSPDLEFDYDFGVPDSSFDFSFNDGDQAKMIGDVPAPSSTGKSESPEGDSPDKRSHPDDDDEGNTTNKRREGEDKVAKKPGRKPLTTEPSSKRKAQNRAAQRAFRERKERHVKELEEKVQELEKNSQSTSKENQLLKAKVDKMTIELNEYKKRISIISANARPISRPQAKPWGSAFINNLEDVNFQFEFPKFGARPSQQAPAKPSVSSSSISPLQKQNSGDQLSPKGTPKDSISPAYSQIGMDSQSRDEVANMSAGLFNSPQNSVDARNGSNISMDSHFSVGAATSTSSPSASSNSNLGASSSCGTSPEPLTQSPLGFKPVDTMTTIGEEQLSSNNSTNDLASFSNIDMDSFNWLPQNDFQFDPHLFGDYREPQANILTNGLDDTFFNEAFDMDFTTPYNLPITSPGATKKGTDLIAQIDAAKEGDDVSPPPPATVTHSSYPVTSQNLLTCNKIWERLQNCPKVQSGDFDLDGLCSDLQKKAKCSGSGAVVDEKDFKNVMNKYLGGKDDVCSMAAVDSITN